MGDVASWAVLVWAVGIGLASTAVSALYLHRGLAHQAVRFTPVGDQILWTLTWLFTGIRPSEWVDVHMRHHRFADQEGDPHSPVVHGLVKILAFNAFYYRRAVRAQQPGQTHVPHLRAREERDPLRSRGWLGVVVAMAGAAVIAGPIVGPVIIALQGVVYVVISGLVNGLCHWVGDVEFDAPGRNIHNPLIAFITAGESLHNTHHRSPGRANLRTRSTDVDTAYMLALLLRRIGFVSHVRRGRTLASVSS